MRLINSRAACWAAGIGLCVPALAGPYSTGLGNINPGAVDPAVAGFAGSALNPAFAGWATGVASYQPAPGVDAGWSDPAKALGPVTGDNFDIVALGDTSPGGTPGQITLEFAGGIRNAPGADLAIFENSLGSDQFVFAELAYVEVSSDGVHFARFTGTSLTPAPVGAYGSIDPTNVHNLAGKHVNAYGNAWGTPFDLNDLTNHPSVQSGQVNLHGIRYVRLTDIPGDGTWRDSDDRPIYDAWLTFGSGGFDLEAIGVTNPWLPGDATLDGAVDITDLGILATYWQQSVEGFTQGDFDRNGFVDITDLGLLASNWQAAAAMPSLAMLPEPNSAAAIAAALVGLGAFARRRSRWPVLAAALLALPALGMAAAADFDDLPLSANSFYNGADLAGGFTSRGTHFSNEYNSTFSTWSGFAYSNVNNTTTPGFGNQHAAITGAGRGGGGNYGVGFDAGAFGAAATITLPQAAAVPGMYVTNTTYTFLAVRDGNDGFGAVRQFGDDPAIPGSGNQSYPDWLKLTITGRDGAGQSAGSVDFFLADYRFAASADDYVIDDWRWVDLSGLSDVSSLTFAISSSDVGAFGINTPTYFALDDVTIVPEPAALAVLGIGLTGLRRVRYAR